jgi:hypothetical protein
MIQKYRNLTLYYHLKVHLPDVAVDAEGISGKKIELSLQTEQRILPWRSNARLTQVGI